MFIIFISMTITISSHPTLSGSQRVPAIVAMLLSEVFIISLFVCTLLEGDPVSSGMLTVCHWSRSLSLCCQGPLTSSCLLIAKSALCLWLSQDRNLFSPIFLMNFVWLNFDFWEEMKSINCFWILSLTIVFSNHDDFWLDSSLLMTSSDLWTQISQSFY